MVKYVWYSIYISVGRKKYLEESIKQENPNSGSKTVWYLEQIGIGSVNATELPSFVSKAIKVNLLKSLFVFSLYNFYIK